ncbi:hypothetical protein SUGI_0058700 [Cryptomeria japonica]|nr:hypothetical protein SUGI_0058700 [Cryptomeria japonica]
MQGQLSNSAEEYLLKAKLVHSEGTTARFSLPGCKEGWIVPRIDLKYSSVVSHGCYSCPIITALLFIYQFRILDVCWV